MASVVIRLHCMTFAWWQCVRMNLAIQPMQHGDHIATRIRYWKWSTRQNYSCRSVMLDQCRNVGFFFSRCRTPQTRKSDNRPNQRPNNGVIGLDDLTNICVLVKATQDRYFRDQTKNNCFLTFLVFVKIKVTNIAILLFSLNDVLGWFWNWN